MSAAQNILLEEKALKLELRLAQLEKNEKCQNDFLTFVRAVWPDFIAGRHHRIIAEKLERVARGDLKRLIINMAPRHTKSEFASYLFPAWFMGRERRVQGDISGSKACGGQQGQRSVGHEPWWDVLRGGRWFELIGSRWGFSGH